MSSSTDSTDEAALQAVVAVPLPDTPDPSMVYQWEQALYKLGHLYGQRGQPGDTQKLADLITNSRPSLQHLSKAKAGKLVWH